MDPLSITATVAGICKVCLAVTQALSDFQAKCQQASLTIGAICAESAVVNAALSQIQSLLFRQGDRIIIRLNDRPDLASAFDTSLTGCMLLYSCLENEVGNLRAALDQGTGLNWKHKFTAVWKENTMQGLLQQIRGQEIALQLLLQSLHM
jgi:hypothetical protein